MNDVGFVEGGAAGERVEGLTACEDEVGAEAVIGMEISWGCCWSLLR